MSRATPAEYGAAYLDEHYPDWADRVDLARFDISDPCKCILGQLFSIGSTNGYTAFVSRLPGPEFVERLGFDVPEDVPYDLVDETWACLDAEWSQLVAARQSQTTPTLTDPQEVVPA